MRIGIKFLIIIEDNYNLSKQIRICENKTQLKKELKSDYPHLFSYPGYYMSGNRVSIFKKKGVLCE